MFSSQYGAQDPEVSVGRGTEEVLVPLELVEYGIMVGYIAVG